MSKVQPRRPLGFIEYLPAQQIAFNAMLRAIVEVFESFGFSPIETPALELAEVLLAKGGGETEKEVFQFSKGDTNYAMHYDLTVPMARYVAEHLADLPMPFRRYQIQKNWRAERPQKGRYREFYQCDIDIVGSEEILHDAEVVAVVTSVFSRLQIGDFVVSINNRKVLQGFIEEIGLAGSMVQIVRLVDKQDKIGTEELRAQLLALDIGSENVDQILDFIAIAGSSEEILTQLEDLSIRNTLFLQGLAELTRVVESLKSMNVDSRLYKLNLAIVRGLDYYTGTVYETQLVDYPEFGSICSGGRYDGLLGYYSKTAMSGVGISIGLTRLFAALLENNLIDTQKATNSRVMIANFGGESMQAGLALASKLRAKSIATQVYFEQGKLEKQFKYANKLGVPFVVVIGEEEILSNKFVLKDMSTGQQSLLDLDGLLLALL